MDLFQVVPRGVIAAREGIEGRHSEGGAGQPGGGADGEGGIRQAAEGASRGQVLSYSGRWSVPRPFEALSGYLHSQAEG